MRADEMAQYSYLMDLYPFRVYTNMGTINSKFSFTNGNSAIKLSGYSNVKFAQLTFLNRNVIAMLTFTNNSNKHQQISIFRQNPAQGELTNNQFSINSWSVVNFQQIGRTYDLTVAADKAVASTWFNLIANTPAYPFQ